VQTFCTSAPHRAGVSCDSTAFLFIKFIVNYSHESQNDNRTAKSDNFKHSSVLHLNNLINILTKYLSVSKRESYSVFWQNMVE